MPFCKKTPSPSIFAMMGLGEKAGNGSGCPNSRIIAGGQQAVCKSRKGERDEGKPKAPLSLSTRLTGKANQCDEETSTASPGLESFLRLP